MSKANSHERCQNKRDIIKLKHVFRKFSLSYPCQPHWSSAFVRTRTQREPNASGTGDRRLP
jgi:hypothetical protein